MCGFLEIIIIVSKQLSTRTVLIRLPSCKQFPLPIPILNIINFQLYGIKYSKQIQIILNNSICPYFGT